MSCSAAPERTTRAQELPCRRDNRPHGLKRAFLCQCQSCKRGLAGLPAAVAALARCRCVPCVRCVRACVVLCCAREQGIASNFLDAPVRSLVRPSNVSPVLGDYPRYLYHQEGETPLASLSSCLRGVQLPTGTSAFSILGNLSLAKNNSGFGVGSDLEISKPFFHARRAGTTTTTTTTKCVYLL